MRSVFLLATFFLLQVASKKLSQEENLSVQAQCGRKLFNTVTPNDNMMNPKQHPWAVAVYTKLKQAGKKTMRFTISPGVIISTRHILISSVVWIKDSEFSILGIQSIADNVTLEGGNVVLSEELLSHFDFGFNFSKAYNWNGDFRNLIASAVVIGAADINKRAPRLMLLELKEDIEFTDDFNAACIPRKSNPWDAVESFPIYGSSLVGIFKVVDFKHVNCSDAAPLVCAESLNLPKSMCEKTAGGGVVDNVNGKFTVMGLFSRRWSCKNHNVSTIKITDVDYYRKEICELSGVCVLPENNIYASLGSTTKPQSTILEITPSDEPTHVTYPAVYQDYIREISSHFEKQNSWTASPNFESTTVNSSFVSTAETHAVTDFPMRINETTTPETVTKPAPTDSLGGIVAVLNKLVGAVQTIQIHPLKGSSGNNTANIVINVY